MSTISVEEAREIASRHVPHGKDSALKRFSEGERVDFGVFSDEMLGIAYREGASASEDVSKLADWSGTAPYDVWLPDAQEALSAVLSLIVSWKRDEVVPEGVSKGTAARFAAILEAAVEGIEAPEGVTLR